jgi:hypothetical protein
MDGCADATRTATSAAAPIGVRRRQAGRTRPRSEDRAKATAVTEREPSGICRQWIRVVSGVCRPVLQTAPDNRAAMPVVAARSIAARHQPEVPGSRPVTRRDAPPHSTQARHEASSGGQRWRPVRTSARHLVAGRRARAAARIRRSAQDGQPPTQSLGDRRTAACTWRNALRPAGQDVAPSRASARRKVRLPPDGDRPGQGGWGG